jgi:SAM-dependent methyltransferase
MNRKGRILAGRKGLNVAEFDAIASNYQKLVNNSIRVTGESSEYFAVYKANYIAKNAVRGGGGKILDYGCGVGQLASQLKRLLPEKQVDGFDVSEKSLEQIEPALLSQGLFTSRVQVLGYGYEAVVLANVLHHVKADERRELIWEAASRVGPGGKMVIFEHNPLNPLTRLAVSQCPFDEGVELLPSGEVRALCESVFQMLRTDYVVFFPRWLAWLRPFEPRLKWCPIGAQHATTAWNMR